MTPNPSVSQARWRHARDEGRHQDEATTRRMGHTKMWDVLLGS